MIDVSIFNNGILQPLTELNSSMAFSKHRSLNYQSQPRSPTPMQHTKEASIEVCKILDSLAVLGADLKCADDIPDEMLVLPAHKTRGACAALAEAVSALKQILQISVEAGGGPVPVIVRDRLDDADEQVCDAK